MQKEFNVPNFIFSSSCTVYGSPDEIPVTEQTPRKPAESPYGATKQMGEDIVKEFTKNGDTKSILLRYFNPVGAHPSALIGELPFGKPQNLVPAITQTAIGKINNSPFMAMIMQQKMVHAFVIIFMCAILPMLIRLLCNI